MEPCRGAGDEHRRVLRQGQRRKVRRCKGVYYAAASCNRAPRIIARVEVDPQGADTLFIFTDLKKSQPRALYEDVYCRGGHAENHIKAFKIRVTGDQTSRSPASLAPSDA